MSSIGHHPGNQVMGAYTQCNAYFSKAAGATTTVTAPEPEQFSVEATVNTSGPKWRRGNQDAKDSKKFKQTPISQNIAKRFTSSPDAFSLRQTLEYNIPAPGAGNTLYHMRENDIYSPQEQNSVFMQQGTGYKITGYDASMMAYQPPRLDMNAAVQRSASTAKLRFCVELSAPMAMIDKADDIPVAYLSMNQAYSMSIVDTTPEAAATLYRTFVRISLDGQQRQDPEIFWQLWEEGSETEEVYQRGGKLQAAVMMHKQSPNPCQMASYDGLSVIWRPDTNDYAGCKIAVRFNFLSSGLSRTRSAGSVPVKFCARTEILNTGQTEYAYYKADLSEPKALGARCQLTCKACVACHGQLFTPRSSEEMLL